MKNVIEKLGFLAGGSRFRRIYEKMQADGDKAYKEAGLNFKSSWFPVYYVLSKSLQPQTVMEITDQIAFSHITVKNIVQELEQEGLIKITPNPGDKRSKLIVLSKKGLALLENLKPIWLSFAVALKKILTLGHPDIINILHRIDTELRSQPLNERLRHPNKESVVIIDYKPSLKKYLYELAGYWLIGYLKGKLEDDENFSLQNPDVAYLQQGGFLFYARYQEKFIGCVALKRLDESAFELIHLCVDPKFQSLGVATKLIDRCISRCKENDIKELWLQTDSGMPQANKIFYKFGFTERKAPPYLRLLERTEKVLRLEL
ncbi:bifunctional helix-turn-helix transcriptional regulator/GNAT family N-acetyltransferase [bacterium]|nr:bifunctional helix-turn-helix transcriptional regulator/GNAT family N-acetyltransferase [bacterium]